MSCVCCLRRFVLTVVLSSVCHAEKMTSTFGVSFQVGETAINRFIKSAVGESHSVDVPSIGNVDVAVNNLGIDLQGSDIVTNVDVTITAQDVPFHIQETLLIPSSYIHIETSEDNVIVYLNLEDYFKTKTKGYPYSSYVSACFKRIVLWTQSYAKQDELVDGLFRTATITKSDPSISLTFGQPENYITAAGTVTLTSESPSFEIGFNHSNFQITSNVRFIVLESWIGDVQGAAGACIGNPKDKKNFSKSWSTSVYSCDWASGVYNWRIVFLTESGRIDEKAGNAKYVK